MKKICILLILTLFSTSASASLIGFGPADIYTSNKETIKISQATLINGGDTPKYGVFTVMKPYSNNKTFEPVPTEMIHCRVTCKTCGWKGQRYEAIPGYQYGDPLIGECPHCHSNQLVFYEPIPRDELRFISLKGSKNFHLQKIGDYTWRTVEKIQPRGTCSIDVLYDATHSYIKENENKHWELHIRGTLQEDTDKPMGMMGGVIIKLFIDFKFPLHISAPHKVKKGTNFTVKVVYGPPDKSWTKIPTNVEVTFNGETKPLNEKGTVVFRMPETRFDYEYELTATGENYLSDTITIVSGIPETTGLSIPILPAIYFLITIIIIFIISVVVWRIKKPWYQ
ncbi:MAG: hypothetical protein DRM98_00225 [Thermoplasmata archaeon]|nr:MAG: hypothetical protein DRM98_00225 [Thermoplasmata archaeon]